MTRILKLPDLGEGLDEAEIVAWQVGPGDHVVADQPLVSVETDKAVVEIPSPWSGTIARVIGAPGDRIKVGAILIEFASEATADAGAIVGTMPAAMSLSPAQTPTSKPKSIVATPAVRALARRFGVDLTALAGRGVGGTITLADVEAATAAPRDGYVPLRGPRRAMAQNMARAHAEVVPATVNDEALVDHLDASADVTLRLIRAMVAGCLAEPALNCWLDGGAMALRANSRIDLGVAMDTKDGLFVPVLRDVAGLSDTVLHVELNRLKQAVRDRSITLADLRGPTITVSNFGTLAGRFASLVVVPPQVAILGAGRIRPRAIVRDGKAMPARVLPLSLTFDHRAVTGGEAARFLAAVIVALEQAA